jgi:hypothetical protein
MTVLLLVVFFAILAGLAAVVLGLGLLFVRRDPEA